MHLHTSKTHEEAAQRKMLILSIKKKKKSITPVLITWSYQMWILDFKSSACCQVDNSQQNLEAISFIAPIWHYTRLQILPEEIEQDFAMPAENIGS